jgi:hypothetical protein
LNHGGPQDATTPEAMADVVATQMTHDRQVEELKREVGQLQCLVETHRAEALMAQERWRNVQLRVRQLGDDQLPPLCARLQEAGSKTKALHARA